MADPSADYNTDGLPELAIHIALAGRDYSPMFSTLHDERSGAHAWGTALYGVHHSVLAADVNGAKHRFVVVWDEDHDTRIVDVIEKLAQLQMLDRFIGFGERKGMMTFILSTHAAARLESDLPAIGKAIKRALMATEPDAWQWCFAAPVEVPFPNYVPGHRTSAYLGDEGQWGTLMHGDAGAYLGPILQAWDLDKH